ncbi:hypothetical protein ACFVVL_34795 [Kitasatospora sp. NPDC058115]|uniref:hypothetical protein n=1 Tax=Kitasatospora sp. NPDC058115 TaxID=3346347 RepID=UPI0036DCF527
MEHRDEALDAVIDRLERLTERIERIEEIHSKAARKKWVGSALGVAGPFIGLAINHWPW